MVFGALDVRKWTLGRGEGSDEDMSEGAVVVLKLENMYNDMIKTTRDRSEMLVSIPLGLDHCDYLHCPDRSFRSILSSRQSKPHGGPMGKRRTEIVHFAIWRLYNPRPNPSCSRLGTAILHAYMYTLQYSSLFPPLEYRNIFTCSTASPCRQHPWRWHPPSRLS